MVKSLQLPYANVAKLSKTVGVLHKNLSIHPLLFPPYWPLLLADFRSAIFPLPHLLVANGHARMIQESDVCYTTLKVDVSRTKLLYVIFEFVLIRITIIYLTKHRCIHVRNFVRKKPPYVSLSIS